jgi:hypothetical protein
LSSNSKLQTTLATLQIAAEVVTLKTVHSSKNPHSLLNATFFAKNLHSLLNAMGRRAPNADRPSSLQLIVVAIALLDARQSIPAEIRSV